MDGGKSDMRTDRVDETLLLKYLLGDLSEEEQVQVEDRAFAAAGYLGAIDAAETDLIDEYVRGGLSDTDRRKFERLFFTSPHRRAKVEFAHALARLPAGSKTNQLLVPQRLPAWQAFLNLMRGWNPAFQLAAAMAALVCIAGACWLTIQYA